MNMTFRFMGLILLLSACLCGGVRAQGLENQPEITQSVLLQINDAAAQYVIRGGEVARARPDLLLIVEASPAADFTYFVAPVLRDYTTYAGIVDTLEEALTKADTKTKPFIIYNLMRVYILRAETLPQGAARKPYAEAARKAAARAPKTLRDAAWFEALGDIEAVGGNTDAAAAYYKKMGNAPMGSSGKGSPAFAYYKTGKVFQGAGRTDDAEAFFKRGLSSDAASSTSKRDVYHFLYQGLAELYLQKGRFALAADSLSESVRVKPGLRPFYLQTGTAQALLQRNPASAQAVLDYAKAALTLNPDLQQMKELRDAAQALVK